MQANYLRQIVLAGLGDHVARYQADCPMDHRLHVLLSVVSFVSACVQENPYWQYECKGQETTEICISGIACKNTRMQLCCISWNLCRQVVFDSSPFPCPPILELALRGPCLSTACVCPSSCQTRVCGVSGDRGDKQALHERYNHGSRCPVLKVILWLSSVKLYVQFRWLSFISIFPISPTIHSKVEGSRTREV